LEYCAAANRSPPRVAHTCRAVAAE
jgi:hypothetical protein